MNIYTTTNGVEINVHPGKKSEYDYIVKYREPGKRERTPKHIHVVIDILMKKVGNEELTRKLLVHIINVIDQLQPEKKYPPIITNFEFKNAYKFSELNNYGDYEIEFILVAIELITIQEKINYPAGILYRKLFEMILKNEDIFSIVGQAAYTGR